MYHLSCIYQVRYLPTVLDASAQVGPLLGIVVGIVGSIVLVLGVAVLALRRRGGGARPVAKTPSEPTAKDDDPDVIPSTAGGCEY